MSATTNISSSIPVDYFLLPPAQVGQTYSISLGSADTWLVFHHSDYISGIAPGVVFAKNTLTFTLTKPGPKSYAVTLFSLNSGTVKSGLVFSLPGPSGGLGTAAGVSRPTGITIRGKDAGGDPTNYIFATSGPLQSFDVFTPLVIPVAGSTTVTTSTLNGNYNAYAVGPGSTFSFTAPGNTLVVAGGKDSDDYLISLDLYGFDLTA